MTTARREGKSLPTFRCHKLVRACKIKDIKARHAASSKHFDGKRIIIPADPEIEPFVVSREYVATHQPQSGGYFVLYEDGYQSFSPAEPFEKGYTQITQEEEQQSGTVREN